MSSGSKKNQDDDGGLTGMLRNVLVGGISTVFLTQEMARTVLSEMKVPKDLLEGLLSNANKTKEDFFESISKEVARVLEKVNLTDEMKQFLQENEIEIQAKVKFHPKDKK